MFSPDRAEVPCVVLDTPRSADAADTVVVALAESFDGFGSAVPDDADAVLVITLDALVLEFTFTTMVKVAVSPDASVEAVQVTVPVLPADGVVHVQPDGADTDWKVVLAGTVSLSLGLAAASGPLFFTATV